MNDRGSDSTRRSGPRRPARHAGPLLLWALRRAITRLRPPLTPRGAPGPLAVRPLIILGHYRSGTTWLQDLIRRDPRYATLTYGEAMFPETIGARSTGSRPLQSLLNALGVEDPIHGGPLDLTRPAEEDVALAAALVPGSPALGHVWMHEHRNRFRRDLFDAGPRAGWLDAWETLVTRLSRSRPGQELVLKSPPHMARIRSLLARVPGAQVLHLVRNPFQVVRSTWSLWDAMERTAITRVSRDERGEEILWFFDRLHAALERETIPRGTGSGIRVGPAVLPVPILRYEDLVDDPEPRLGTVFRTLGRPPLRPASPGTISRRSPGSESRHDVLSGDDGALWIDRIRTRWARWFERFGYDPGEVPTWP